MKKMRLLKIVLCSGVMGFGSLAAHRQESVTAAQTTKAITIFIEKAKASGFSDQEIATTLEQASHKGLSVEQISEFFDAVVKQKDSNNGEQVDDGSLQPFWYAAIAGGCVVAGFVLYQLYQSLSNNVPDTEITLDTDPEGVISEEELNEAQEQIRNALLKDEDPNYLVFDLADNHHGVRVKARWSHGGANHSMSVEY